MCPSVHDPRVGFALLLSPVEDEQLPSSAYWARSASNGLPSRAPTLQDHELLTPPAPGALQATTSYVPAEAAGTAVSNAAAATTIPANPRIRAPIRRECTPLEVS